MTLAGVDMSPETPSSDPTLKAKYIREGVQETVRHLIQGGHQVLIVQTIPSFWNPRSEWDPR